MVHYQQQEGADEPARVFLSHSSQDKQAADQFAQAFRQAGADVWYDEESLGAGHLRRAIMKELGERPVFVVLLSKAALASSWVLRSCEWAYDLQRGDSSRVLLPVVIEPLVWADLNMVLYLRSLKRVEAGDLHPLSLDDSIKQTLRLLGIQRAEVQRLLRRPVDRPCPSHRNASHHASPLWVTKAGLSTASRLFSRPCATSQQARSSWAVTPATTK